jgi:hypothetical protein
VEIESQTVRASAILCRQGDGDWRVVSPNLADSDVPAPEFPRMKPPLQSGSSQPPAAHVKSVAP